MKIFRLALRLIIGALFVGHGTHKLFGWFGGRGLKGTAEAFERMGLRPSMPNAIAAGVSETGGGVLVAAGFLTPLGASMIMGSMFTAIHPVHGKNGPWVTDGGYEYNLVRHVVSTAVAPPEPPEPPEPPAPPEPPEPAPPEPPEQPEPPAAPAQP